jgi:hypothetical protein
LGVRPKFYRVALRLARGQWDRTGQPLDTTPGRVAAVGSGSSVSVSIVLLERVVDRRPILS